jgi:hypothetical protein
MDVLLFLCVLLVYLYLPLPSACLPVSSCLPCPFGGVLSRPERVRSARIVAHLRTRAKEFATEVPAFLNRKQQDPRPQAAKRKFKKFQHYMTSEETHESDSQEEEQTQLYIKKGHPKGLGKGLGKGKGKGKKGKPGNQRRLSGPST